MAVELYKEYKERVIPAPKEQRGYKNIQQVPKVGKVVSNCFCASHTHTKQAL